MSIFLLVFGINSSLFAKNYLTPASPEGEELIVKNDFLSPIELIKPKPLEAKPLPFFFRTLPIGLNFSKSEFYHFDMPQQRFDKIVERVPILTENEANLVGSDPIRFTLTPNKTAAKLGETIELTLTAELMNVSPQLLFTFEELRNYTLKVVLPKDFIMTGGTYYDFVSGTLDPQNPIKNYTIKGMYVDIPAQDDCFKVLRKLNDEVFVLKNTACLDISDIDTEVVATANSAGREASNLLDDVSLIKYVSSVETLLGETVAFFDGIDGVANVNCKTGNKRIRFLSYDTNGSFENRSIKWQIYINNSTTATATVCSNSSQWFGSPIMNLNSNDLAFRGIATVYNTNNCTGSTLDSKILNLSINWGACPTTPPPTQNYIAIVSNETAACPGGSISMTAGGTCPVANILWQKGGVNNGSTGATFTATSSGTYNAVCSSVTMTSNGINLIFSAAPTVPNVRTNKHSITPGEFAVLSATNCQGSVVWNGSNNFTDVGDEISVNKPGAYTAVCRSNCNGTVYISDASTTIDISLLPIRLEATKYEIYANESTVISAFGCTNGYIAWKINGVAIPISDNPLSTSTYGVYEATCNSFDGPSSTAVAIYIAPKAANIPRLTASATQAYPTDIVVLSATGCPAGWNYAWRIYQKNSSGITYLENRTGTPQNVVGPSTSYVACSYGGSIGPEEGINIGEIHPGDIILTPNKTEANIGEAVAFTVTGNCPSSAGIRWVVNGMNYWTNRYEAFTTYGPGTFTARCESGYLFGNYASVTIKLPQPGAVSIIADKTRAKSDELVTLRAIGCDKEVVWTLPNNTEVRGSSILFNFGPGIYKAACVRFGFTGPKASITIAQKNGDEPSIVQTNTSIGINELAEYTMTGCPNNWVQWGVPKLDAQGNIVYDYSYFFKTLLITKPGTYKVRCQLGNYTAFQDIIVHPAAQNSLIIKASRLVAKPTEQVVLTAFGCPNGIVQWQNGIATPTGTRITVTGPGLRKAKCVGDFSNNGDWAINQTRADGDISPYLTASATEACPNEPVTINAYGCPAGWHHQLQWVNPGQLEYWLNNRNQVENMGVGFWEVFSFAGGNITRNGPGIYYARCISPDYGWMGEFRNKSITIEPAFPTDLRATNNGPALTGTPSVQMAVTDVPNASYAWTGPNAFVSAVRNPTITTPTEANAGIYTITLNRGAGQPWGCQVTATTKVAISGCDIRIKASDPTTGNDLTTLQKDPINAGQYLPIALTAENGDGTPIQNMAYTWTAPSGVTLTTPNAAFILVQKSGNYSLRVSALTNSSVGCRTTIQIAQENTQEILWAKRYQSTFANGTPVKVVPLQYNGGRRRYISNATNAQITIDVQKYIGHSMMLLYTKNSVSRKDIMHVIPTDAYNNTHTAINSTDFSGWVKIYDYTGTIYRGGWKYANGVVLGRIAEYNVAASPNDDCVIRQVSLEEYSPGGVSGSSPKTYSNVNDVINNAQKGDQVVIGGKTFIFGGVREVPCCVNCVPLGTSQGEDSPSTNGESPANSETLKGGATSQPTTTFGELICVQVAQLLACAEKNTPQAIINRNPNDTPDMQAAKFEESKKRFALYVKLIEQALKDHPILKPYASQINFPTSQATLDLLAGSYGNAIADQQSYESVGCALTSGFGTGTIPPSQIEILADDLGRVCHEIDQAYKALVPLIEDCNNANGLVNDILNTLQTQNLNVVKVFKYGKNAEDADITSLWNGLKGSQTPVTTNNPDNPLEVMLLRSSDGVKMRYSPTNGAIYSYLKFSKEECDNKIQIDLCKLLDQLDLTNYKDLNKFIEVANARSQGMQDPVLQQQIVNLREQIHYTQLAQLSRAVYNDKSDPVKISSLTQITTDPANVVALINNANNNIPGFHAVLYNDNSTNPPKKILVYRGTNDLPDGITDLINGVGYLTPQYTAAVNIARTLALSNSNIEFAGHSLGGGLAGVSAAVTGKQAFLFNPAGINYGILSGINMNPPMTQAIFDANKANSKVIINENDPLNLVQDNRNTTLAVITAIGAVVPRYIPLIPLVVTTIANGGLQPAYGNYSNRVVVKDNASYADGHSITRMGNTLEESVKLTAGIIKTKIKPKDCK